MKWADVQQIASRASCSTNVISLSLVIISRSVGWEIQIRLPEGCKRKNSWTRYKTLPTAHVEDVLTTIHMCMLGEVEGGNRSSQTGSEVIIPLGDCQITWTAAAGPRRAESLQCGDSLAQTLPSCLNAEKHFHLSSCSFSIDVMVFKTSVLWCHQWLFIVYVLGNCDNA